MDDEFLIPASEFELESPPTKGSRFLARIAAAESAESAEAFVDRIRGADPDATHHCWAYRTGRPCDRFRFSDDGEPGGSAGRPILQQIEGHGLTDTVCVVTRWYGGTKLGVGGLIRAYGGAAARALDRLPTERVLLQRRVSLSLPYEHLSAVQRMLELRSLTLLSSDYGELVRFELDLPLRDVESFGTELRDRTSGQVRLEEP